MASVNPASLLSAQFSAWSAGSRQSGRQSGGAPLDVPEPASRASVSSESFQSKRASNVPPASGAQQPAAAPAATEKPKWLKSTEDYINPAAVPGASEASSGSRHPPAAPASVAKPLPQAAVDRRTFRAPGSFGAAAIQRHGPVSPSFPGRGLSREAGGGSSGRDGGAGGVGGAALPPSVMRFSQWSVRRVVFS